jgi:hypothetical protein
VVDNELDGMVDPVAKEEVVRSSDCRSSYERCFSGGPVFLNSASEDMKEVMEEGAGRDTGSLPGVLKFLSDILLGAVLDPSTFLISARMRLASFMDIPQKSGTRCVQ